MIQKKTEPTTISRVSSASPRATSIDPLFCENRRVVVIGVGGIGSFLVKPLAMFLASLHAVRVHLSIVDGDSFEERNRSRMEVPELGNKADVVCSLLSASFSRPKFYIRPIDQYVREDNVDAIIGETDIVFACVDNHATRKIISDRCAMLEDVVLISGGNDGVDESMRGTYGNIQVFRRQGGLELNPSLTRFHPEIETPSDEVPGPGCEDLIATTEPQLLWTNFFAAAAMGAAFQRLLTATPEEGLFDEACFDVFEMTMTPQRLMG